MRYLAPQGIKQCVEFYLRMYSKIKDTDFNLSAWTVWRSKQYMAELQAEALKKYQPGWCAATDGLVDAKPLSDVSDSDEDTTTGPRQHDLDEVACQVRSGHTAATKQRSNLVRLEHNFGFPVHVTVHVRVASLQYGKARFRRRSSMRPRSPPSPSKRFRISWLTLSPRCTR